MFLFFFFQNKLGVQDYGAIITIIFGVTSWISGVYIFSKWIAKRQLKDLIDNTITPIEKRFEKMDTTIDRLGRSLDLLAQNQKDLKDLVQHHIDQDEKHFETMNGYLRETDLSVRSLAKETSDLNAAVRILNDTVKKYLTTKDKFESNS